MIRRIEAYKRGQLGVYYVNMTHPAVGQVQTFQNSQMYRCFGTDWTIVPRITASIEQEIVVAVAVEGVYRHRTLHTIPWVELEICCITILEHDCDMGGEHDCVRPVNQEPGTVHDFCRKCGRWLQRIGRDSEVLFVLEENARRAFPSFLHHDHVRTPRHLLTDAIVLDRDHPAYEIDLARLTTTWYHHVRVHDDANGNPVICYAPPRY